MSTQTTTTTAYVLIDQYGQSTSKYRGASFGHGIVSLALFASKEEALAELNRWMNEAAQALEYTEDEFKARYSDYTEELDEDDQVMSYEEWLAANYPKGAGYYSCNSGDFLGAFGEEHYDHGDNWYSIYEATVVEESPAEPTGTLADEITKAVTFRGYSIQLDRWNEAL